MGLIRLVIFLFLANLAKANFPKLDTLFNPGRKAPDGKATELPCTPNPTLHAINSNVTYKIQTPMNQFGFPYPNSFDCVWKFYGTGCTPLISCDSFKLAESAGCGGNNGGYLEVTDRISASERFCGTNGPKNATTGSSILEAIYPRSIAIPSGGFSCLVTCSEKIEPAEVHVIPTTLPPPATKNCSCGIPGNSSASPNHRVVGGKNAAPLYWKWQAGLLAKTRKNPFCGASLINDRFLLTAAHCTVTTGLFGFPPAADVLLNEYDLKDSTETITIRRSIVAITAHPFYDPVGQDYDFAVIEFEPIDLTATAEPKVTPVCLPARGTTDTYAGQKGTVTGWGTLTEGGNQATILQEVEIPIITNEVCQQMYKKDVDDPRMRITARMLCAAYPEGGIDSCQGDSGGPFVVCNDGKCTEIGVVSFGEGCARKTKPGVYSRVTEVNDWIRQVAHRGVWCQE